MTDRIRQQAVPHSLNRLFGLILTAIAVEIMANGLRDLFPVLAG